jgi:hypothetical protein
MPPDGLIGPSSGYASGSFLLFSPRAPPIALQFLPCTTNTGCIFTVVTGFQSLLMLHPGLFLDKDMCLCSLKLSNLAGPYF